MMKPKNLAVKRLGLVAAVFSLVCLLAPMPVQADDWGFSLDLPFFRVRSHDGHYYRDNDYPPRYGSPGRHYAPEHRHYYYPRRGGVDVEHIQRNPDGTIYHETDRRWIGPDGRVYERP